MDLREAVRGSGIEPTSVSSPNRTPVPLIRMIATPAGGGPLERAKIVSFASKMQSSYRLWVQPPRLTAP